MKLHALTASGTYDLHSILGENSVVWKVSCVDGGLVDAAAKCNLHYDSDIEVCQVWNYVVGHSSIDFFKGLPVGVNVSEDSSATEARKVLSATVVAASSNETVCIYYTEHEHPRTPWGL